MLVIRIELHSAITKKITVIGEMIVHNVGGTASKGNYEVCVGRKNHVGNLKKIFHEPLRRGKVQNHPRKSQNVWRLVTKALLSVFPEENKSKS